jgi:hypothetical protein
MALYFLHLRDRTDESLDPAGVEYADTAALKKGVIANARGVLAGQVADEGMLDLRYRIDAEDETGKVVYSLPFKHAITIIGDDA